VKKNEQTCGGVLAYETMAGAFRVHKAGVYRFRCQKCGLEGENDGEARACTATLQPRVVRDGLGMELDDDATYYLQDTRQKVGNCMLFWCHKDLGYTCQLDDAGKYTGPEARDRCRDGTHKAWPVGFIERNAVRHVRADSIDVRLAKIEKGRSTDG
jgi:hypothetical protein